MTVKELSRLYGMNQRIAWNQARLESLEKELAEAEKELYFLRRDIDGLASPSLSGMPHGSDVHSAVENRVERITQLEAVINRWQDERLDLMIIIAKQQTLAIEEERKILEFVDTLDDPYMGYIICLRFIDCLPWGDVVEKSNYHGNQKSLRDTVYKLLRKTESQ